ncbi:MAG: DUF4440 domain-containing protein [Azospirillum sp.]|nr:DUF4440 domain-containing protein [Azospirillum sp.]
MNITETTQNTSFEKPAAQELIYIKSNESSSSDQNLVEDCFVGMVHQSLDSWVSAVTSGRPDAPDLAVAHYAPNGVLWATYSDTIRDNTAAIREYFVRFTALPKLSCQIAHRNVRVNGDVAVVSGGYTFSYEKDGARVDVPARFSFVFSLSEGKWLILDHHSSVIPAIH